MSGPRGSRPAAPTTTMRVRRLAVAAEKTNETAASFWRAPGRAAGVAARGASAAAAPRPAALGAPSVYS